MRWILLGLAALALFVSPALADTNVTAELLTDTTAIQPGKPFSAAIHLHVASGMHVYWINAGDGGGPIRVNWHLPTGFTAGPLNFPVPEILPQPGNLTVYGYENECLLTTTITPPATLQASTIRLHATVNWVVCSTEQCFFGNTDLSSFINVGDPHPANTDLFSAWQPRMPRLSSDAFSSLDATRDDQLGTATLIFHWKSGITPPSNLNWIPGPGDDLTIRQTNISSTADTTTLTLSIMPIKGIPQTQSTITGLLSYHDDNQPSRGIAVTLDRKTLRLIDDAPK